MKRILYISALCLLTAMAAQAQAATPYRPLAKEGKVWNFKYLNVRSNEPTHRALYYNYIIQGDTVINGLDYKKIFFRHSKLNLYTAALRDEGSRVYMVPADSTEESIYYDLELNKDTSIVYGSQVRPYGGPFMIDSHGLRLRQQSWINIPVFIHQTWDWIESIGCTEDFFKCQFLNDEKNKPVSSGIGGYGGLISCFEDGVCVYGDENWTPNVQRTSIPLTYEIKKGLNHAPSDIWVEAEDGFMTIYMKDVQDHFVLYETACHEDGSEYTRKQNTDFYGLMFQTFPLPSVEWSQANPGFYMSYRLESDYELFTFDINTAVHDIVIDNNTSNNRKSYDLSGRRLTSQPTHRGVYIIDGKKVVVR